MNRRDVLIGAASFIALPALPAMAAERRALDWVNQFRRQKGRRALRWSSELTRAAEAHALDMSRRGFFSHTGSDGSNVGKRVKRTGYRWCRVAENIARGQGSLEAALTGWQGSAGHRKNMLHRDVSEIGVARGPGNTWVMVLARGC